MSCSEGGHSNTSSYLRAGEWQVASTYQYFKSFRHFRGSEEEAERVENHTQVENISHSADLSFATAITDQITLGFNIPFLYYDRSSLYEHYGNSTTSNPDQKRFHTGSVGLGDSRLTVNYWIFNPDRDSLRGNLAIGGGIKIPTGNANVQDDFHKLSSSGEDSLVHKAVDQSIQLGDGGWGIVIQSQGFLQMFSRGSLYFSGFYLFNPRNENDTWTRGYLEGVDPLIAFHSVADQYAVRFGLSFLLWPKSGLSINAGTRLEGVPSHDAFGKEDGFRRPGMVISVDPGISVQYHQLNMSLNVPVALYRNRTKSVYDQSDPTGQRHGDAAFADYLLSFSHAYRFGGHRKG